MNFQEFINKFQKWPVKEFPNKVTKNPLVSVCVQTYQHKNFIAECLENILNQETSFEFEILLGEDDSTDGTREICVEFAEKYPDKIKLFLHDRRNQIKVLNEATGNFPAFYNIFSARGNYIAICEGDDYWTDPQKLQKQVDYLEKHPQCSIAYHKYKLIDKDGKIIRLALEQPEKDIDYDDLIMAKFHPLFLCVCFKNCFKTYPVQIMEVINVDTFLLSLLGQKGMANYMPNISPSFHRIHSGGTWGSRKKNKKLISKIHLYSKIEDYYLEKGNLNLALYYKALKKNYRKSLFVFYLKKGKLHLIIKNIHFLLEK